MTNKITPTKKQRYDDFYAHIETLRDDIYRKLNGLEEKIKAIEEMESKEK